MKKGMKNLGLITAAYMHPVTNVYTNAYEGLSDVKYPSTPKNNKTPLTKAQKKVRVKNKQAKKSRKINRKKL